MTPEQTVTEVQVIAALERAAPLRPTSRGFLPWRLSDDGPGARGQTPDGAVVRNPSHKRPLKCHLPVRTVERRFARLQRNQVLA
jgi:hypothetical protein